MKKLILFDIEGTLMKNLPEHAKSFSDAFKKVYKINTEIDGKAVHGMTDQQIIITTLKNKGLTETVIKAKIKRCMNEMIKSFNQHISKKTITPLKGVVKLLKELNKHPLILGLTTGNLKEIAKVKLEKEGIWKYFKTGGFGSDDIDRTNLIKLAIQRAKEKLGFKFDNNVFIIGDTPRDIKAGKEAGVKTIGVATGVFSKKQLKDVGADYVLENLKDTKKVLEIIC